MNKNEILAIVANVILFYILAPIAVNYRGVDPAVSTMIAAFVHYMINEVAISLYEKRTQSVNA